MTAPPTRVPTAVPTPPTPAPVPSPAPELTPAQRRATLVGVMVSMLLAALDQTIVTTAGPAIQADLAMSAALYPWITTAYLVASTVMVPIYGKLSDRVGRRPVLLVGIGLFLLGSALCGLAPTAMLLVAARAVQGLGAAALFTTALAVVADLFPPSTRGRYVGLISGVMGIASIVGPLVGGIITDTVGWHWVFLVNLPIGAVALWIVIRRMPNLGAQAERPPFDVAGAALLVLAVVPLLVALSLGRTGEAADGGLPWASAPILGMLGTSLLAMAAFGAVERRAIDPILRLDLLRDRVVGLGSATMFVLGAGFLFGIVFLPLFLVNVVGVSATRAGLVMMPLTLGVVAGSIASGQLVTRLGRYRGVLIGGLGLLVTAFALMSLAVRPDVSQLQLTLLMVASGLGLGPTMPLYTLAMQNAASAREVGVVTALATFSRSLGQVIGIAILGAVFATTLGSALARETGAVLGDLPPAVRAAVADAAPVAAPAVSAEEGAGAALALDTAAVRASLRAAPLATTDRERALAAVPALQQAVGEAFSRATSRLYLIGAGIVIVALLLTLRIPDRPLRAHTGDAPHAGGFE